MGLNRTPPTSPPPTPVQVPVTEVALVTTATVSDATVAISPGGQVSIADTVTTSAVVSSIPTMIPTVSVMASPTMSTVWTPSHPKYRATL